jgi:hypothetical protein
MNSRSEVPTVAPVPTGLTGIGRAGGRVGTGMDSRSAVPTVATGWGAVGTALFLAGYGGSHGCPGSHRFDENRQGVQPDSLPWALHLG